MIKVGIIGSTGYAGQELVRILLQHPDAEIVWYGSRSYIDKKYSEVFGNIDNVEQVGKHPGFAISLAFLTSSLFTSQSP